MWTDILLSFWYIFRSIGLFFVPKEWRAKKILDDDVVLITGGGSGLGQQFGLTFAKRGVRKIVLVDVNEEGMKATTDMIRKQSPSCDVFTYVVDVTKRVLVYSTAEKIKNEVGTVTYLINNAGIVSGAPLLTTPDEKIVKTFEVNSISHFWVSDTSPAPPPLIPSACSYIIPLITIPDVESLPTGDDRAKPWSRSHDRISGWTYRTVPTRGLRRLQTRGRRDTSSSEAGTAGRRI